MTVAIPAVTFPGARTGRDMTGHRPASGLLVIMAGPVTPPPGPGSQPVPPPWSGDRSGLWLRNAAAGLCVLAAAAAAVSFTALPDGRRHQPSAGGRCPGGGDPGRGRAGLRLPGHRAGLARPPRAAGPGAEPGLGRRQRVHERDRGRAGLAEPGHLGHAAGRLRPGQRHPHHGHPRPPPAAGRRRGHPAGHPRRPDPVAAAPGPGAGLDPGRVPRLGARGMPGRPRPPGLAICRGPAGPGRGDGPAEGDQDRPVPFPGRRTARASRLHPAGSRRPGQRRPGPGRRPAPRRRPRRPPQSRPVRPQRRPS